MFSICIYLFIINLEMPNQGHELKISISHKLYILRISYRLCIVTMFDCKFPVN